VADWRFDMLPARSTRTNENGTPYATFTFQVRDNGGTAGGGQIDVFGALDDMVTYHGGRPLSGLA